MSRRATRLPRWPRPPVTVAVASETRIGPIRWGQAAAIDQLPGVAFRLVRSVNAASRPRPRIDQLIAWPVLGPRNVISHRTAETGSRTNTARDPARMVRGDLVHTGGNVGVGSACAAIADCGVSGPARSVRVD